MIINDELFILEDCCNELVTTLLSSETTANYQKKRLALNNSQTVKELQQAFQKHKNTFEEIERFSSFAPDYKAKKVAVFQAKRQLDLNETVAEFRVAETNLQELLDEVCLSVANTISKSVKVSAGNPFFETKEGTSCKGDCHHG
ncbi:cell fate (sporulation/competence/biofilm development) regulator YlbF (YheA/YmcA/DUF963 family) [Enterococcus sp. PF1-24]|uniref:YlbF family regulator n=1 Tax=unclassified Enterococcus TaxID=2608891 RepID=UPI0024771B82|nr:MULTISPECIES: YlbF family regulator [unclassified Enterococcus]MDH6364225.1 cell fate (sporulation/competence/biofilm development) regulator YlbF (YheA/YmcA/DUF963 family) [Enterococcus sp. PFB1-1]MDH6401326.1 cell fate (sporulation/competence/biofilm development) regulator YlbF (YheA/YmcA/DUF963 family) [Enterococcus sp. PF1-24]